MWRLRIRLPVAIAEGWLTSQHASYTLVAKQAAEIPWDLMTSLCANPTTNTHRTARSTRRVSQRGAAERRRLNHPGEQAARVMTGHPTRRRRVTDLSDRAAESVPDCVRAPYVRRV